MRADLFQWLSLGDPEPPRTPEHEPPVTDLLQTPGDLNQGHRSLCACRTTSLPTPNAPNRHSDHLSGGRRTACTRHAVNSACSTRRNPSEGQCTLGRTWVADAVKATEGWPAILK